MRRRWTGMHLGAAKLREVMDLLAAGYAPWRVAHMTGVSTGWVHTLHHRVGGVYRPPGTSYSRRFLDRDERYEIARLREGGHSIRQVAQRLGRDPATISRELRRNADARTGGYQPGRAERRAWERQRRPKPSKLAGHPPLRAEVQRLLDKRYSPQQVAGRLAREHPDNPGMRISHETIYQSLYVYPRGELKRELQAHLRTGRRLRQPRGRVERRSPLPDPVSIHDRPAEIETRLVPGHHEGDLILGSRESHSAIGTIVERTSGYLTLLHLPDGRRAEQVAAAITTQMGALPDWFAKSLTWDRGTELARHKEITAAIGLQVYFADPDSPYQRGSNENINGLLREYFPKGSDLSAHSAADLARVAAELNDRPRKRFDYQTPNEVLANLLTAELARVATTP